MTHPSDKMNLSNDEGGAMPTVDLTKLSPESRDHIQAIAEQVGKAGVFSVDDILRVVDPQADRTKVRQTIQWAVAEFAAKAWIRIIRVDHPRSGRYRLVGPNEDLRTLKREQPRLKLNQPKRRQALPPLTPTTTVVSPGSKLEVLEVRDDLALVRCDDGHVYRIVLERVL